MKNRKYIVTILSILVVLILYIYQYYTPSGNVINIDETSIETDGFNFLPTSTTNQIVRHNYLTLSYHEDYEQAEWVAYELKATHISNTNKERPYFIYDKKVKTKSANYRNYKGSGYDRGHLCPAGDRKFNAQAYNETFLTSNISPQRHGFNSGIWNRLEQKTRYWAKKDKHLYIVTGGILKKGLKTIGQENVAVPEQFYKILLDYSKPQIKAIAFLIPHKDSNAPLYEYVVSIDKIEQLTAIDFFPDLPDTVEIPLEKSSNFKNWSF